MTKRHALLGSILVAGLVFAAAPQVFAQAASVAGAGQEEGNRVLLTPGELYTLRVQREVGRVAVGNPDIADVTILSPKEVLIQAKSIGVTNIIVWGAAGEQSEVIVNVVDPRPLSVSKELERVLSKSDRFRDVQVELERDKVILVGQVHTEEAFASLLELIASYPDVIINMVSVAEVEEIEMPERMVKLQVQVIEMSRSDAKSLGISWTDEMTISENPVQTATYRSFSDTMNFGESVGRDPLFAIINALITENRARLLSEPKLVTTSGKEATAHLGLEVPVLTTASFSDTTDRVRMSIEYREVGVLLTMTPRAITHDGIEKISIMLKSEVSSIDETEGLNLALGGATTVLVPAFKVRRAETEVITGAGEPVIIAGLLASEDKHTTRKVPFLHALPVVGKLFQSPDIERVDQELLITITPDFVHGVEGTATAREVAFRQAVDQARSVQAGGVIEEDPVLSYVRQVQMRIASALEYPQGEQQKDPGTVRLRLHILEDGMLERVVISNSSGVDSFDLEAVQAASAQAPYPALPEEIKAPDLWVEVPVVFRP